MRHAIIVPVFGESVENISKRLRGLESRDISIVYVDNNQDSSMQLYEDGFNQTVIPNRNVGLVAGGFNRGIDFAVGAGAEIITLIDQDTEITRDDIERLGEALVEIGGRCIIGPEVADAWKKNQQKASLQEVSPERILISAGTTFWSRYWEELGRMNENMGIDFVDHVWCSDARAKGFKLYKIRKVVIRQKFGERHMSAVCRILGMQFYRPKRHYYSLRSIGFLVRNENVPLRLKLGEVIRMTIKPWLWLVFEPRRKENAMMVVRGLKAAYTEEKSGSGD